MVDTLAYLISEFGYLAVGIGCFFEGEAAILLGILAAHRDLLHVEGVVVAAVIGTVIGDNICFHAGRRLGRPALEKRPGWQAKTVRVEHLLARFGAPLMIGFRFLYGVRYVTPFVLGSLGVSPLRFLALESIGAVLWAITVAVIGTYLADALQQALTHIQNVEQILVIALLVAVLLGFALYRMRRHLRPPWR